MYALFSTRQRNLKNADPMSARQIKGYQLSVRDVYDLQLMCAYETVALGGSKFCELFSDDEFESFSYSSDLVFWYMFGQCGACLRRWTGRC